MSTRNPLHLFWSLNQSTPDTDEMTMCLRQRLKSLAPGVALLNLQVHVKVLLNETNRSAVIGTWNLVQVVM